MTARRTTTGEEDYHAVLAMVEAGRSRHRKGAFAARAAETGRTPEAVQTSFYRHARLVDSPPVRSRPHALREDAESFPRVLAWEAPPPPVLVSRWDRVIDEVAARPGEWAFVFEGEKASGQANSLRTAIGKRFRGESRRWTVSLIRGQRVYVRVDPA